MDTIIKHLDTLVNRYPKLIACKDEILKAYELLVDSYAAGGKLLVTGNGGSASDSEHIVGELMKAFVLPRKLPQGYKNNLCAIDEELGPVLSENLQCSLPAIALDGHIALSTANMNDCETLLCFAQQVNGYGVNGDVFLGISTSGNSKNVLYAAVVAKAKGMKVIGLTDRLHFDMETFKKSNVWNVEINWNIVHEKLLQFRKSSWDYLKTIINK